MREIMCLSDMTSNRFAFAIHASFDTAQAGSKSLPAVKNCCYHLSDKPFKFHLSNEEVTQMIHRQDDEFIRRLTNPSRL